jgi:hypothetical protein
MKLGFICEGKTEKKIVESPNFQQFLTGIGHTCVPDIIDAKGNGNLLPEHLVEFTEVLLSKGAEKIVVLTDLDEDACITLTKQRINAPQSHVVIISVKKIEAWFLADDVCMSKICKTPIHFEQPEQEQNPFQTIKSLLLLHTNRGVSDKILLAAKVIFNDFSILQASTHPNCHSAKYLVNRLSNL